MTGYGKHEENINFVEIIAEVKSVNHRYFEPSIRLQRSYNYMDEQLRKLVCGYVSRGKVELAVLINNTKVGNSNIQLNAPMIEQCIKQLRDIAQNLDVNNALSISDILNIPDVFVINQDKIDNEGLLLGVKCVVIKALENFLLMRVKEGEQLYNDINQRILSVQNMLVEIEEKSPQTVKNYKERIYSKINQLISSNDISEQRVLTEVALLADKVSVVEETVRISIHLENFINLLLSDEPVGRKLDFLIQEINREVNTIGSKCQDVLIASIVIDMKSELEKIREQVQNIE